jgi:hypothetical protein
VSFDENDYAREEYEGELERHALEEGGLEYALTERTHEVEEAVKDWQAEEWLEDSRHWLQLVNIISQHDREQLRENIREKAFHPNKPPKVIPGTDSQLFNLASEISKLLESLAGLSLRAGLTSDADEAKSSSAAIGNLRYGYCPQPAVSPLARYVQQCTICEDLSWASALVTLTRSFREVLFAISDPQRGSLEWELSEHIRTIDAALEKGTRDNLVYRGLGGRQHRFAREPNPASTPLASLLADWICDYLVNYSDRIDLGACVECGKVFHRRRSDNTYCSKTCQNRVAYKRKRIFETGLLKKIEITEKTATQLLQPGVWVYHARLGLGVIETVSERYRRFLSVTVRFPQVVRTFSTLDCFQSKPNNPKMEFYVETDAAALAELL